MNKIALREIALRTHCRCVSRTRSCDDDDECMAVCRAVGRTRLSDFISVMTLFRNLGLREAGTWQSGPGGAALCSRLGGLSRGQRRFWQLYDDHMPSVARAARLAVAECQRQFRYRRWNCSTVPQQQQQTGSANVTSSSLFGHVTDIGLLTFVI